MKFLYPTCIKRPRRGWPRQNFVKMFDAGKTSMIELPYGEINYDDMLSRFHLILEGRGTDGQTDGRTDLLYRYRASICWRAIKIDKCIICKESGGGPQNGWLAFYWIICWLQYAYEATTISEMDDQWPAYECQCNSTDWNRKILKKSCSTYRIVI